MILPLNRYLRLEGRPLAWELQKRRTRQGKDVWEPIKYYRRLGHALAEAGEREVRLMEGSSLADAAEAFTRVTDRYRKILDGAFSELSRRADRVEQRETGR